MAHWKDFFVQVRVDLGNGNSLISTGYPIGPSHVLTAWHGLITEKFVPTPGCISIHWLHLRNKQTEVCKVESILWSCADLDAAVLEITMPDVPITFGVLSSKEADPNSVWESRGYAAVGRDESLQEPTELKGSSFSAGTFDKNMVLSNEAETNPKSSRDVNLDWKGISGAAVFQNGKIIGLINSVEGAFDGKRITATRSVALVNSAVFASLYDSILDDASALAGERINARERRILSILENHDSLRTEILKRLGERGYNPASASADAVVDFLLSRVPEHEATAIIVFVQNQYSNAGEMDSAAKTQELLYEILPAIFGPYGLQLVLQRLESATGALVSLPVGQGSIVEAVMAAADDRSVRYRMHGNNDLVGTYQIPDAPESGIASGAGNQLLSDLGDLFCVELSARLEKKLVKSLRADLSGDDATKEETIRTAIEDHLSDESADKRTHYFIVPASLDETDPVSSQLKEVERLFPSLICIRIAADNKTIAAHLRALRPLKKMHDSANQSVADL